MVKINVLTAAELCGAMGASIGFILGILYSFGGAVYDLFTIGWNLGTVLAFGALIGMPVIFAIPGLLLGGISAALYNVLRKEPTNEA